MSIVIRGYSHEATLGQPPLPSFLDALMTWDGDILRLTLSTGEKVTGIIAMSRDGQTVWVTGEWKVNAVTRDYKLHDITKEVGYRVEHVIGVEFIRDQSKELPK